MMRILELGVRFEPNLRDGVRWVRILELVVRFSGLVRVFPSVRFALSQFNFFVRILEISSGERRILEMSYISTNLRDGSSLVQS